MLPNESDNAEITKKRLFMNGETNPPTVNRKRKPINVVSIADCNAGLSEQYRQQPGI